MYKIFVVTCSTHKRIVLILFFNLVFSSGNRICSFSSFKYTFNQHETIFKQKQKEIVTYNMLKS